MFEELCNYDDNFDDVEVIEYAKPPIREVFTVDGDNETDKLLDDIKRLLCFEGYFDKDYPFMPNEKKDRKKNKKHGQHHGDFTREIIINIKTEIRGNYE